MKRTGCQLSNVLLLSGAKSTQNNGAHSRKYSISQNGSRRRRASPKKPVSKTACLGAAAMDVRHNSMKIAIMARAIPAKLTAIETGGWKHSRAIEGRLWDTTHPPAPPLANCRVIAR